MMLFMSHQLLMSLCFVVQKNGESKKETKKKTILAVIKDLIVLSVQMVAT